MSSTLTATIHRAADVIDLTNNDGVSTDDEVCFLSSRPVPRPVPQPAAPRKHTSSQRGFSSSDEPQAKRIKTQGDDETANLREYVQHCLSAQVYPHISTALDRFAPASTNRHQLFQAVLQRLTGSQDFTNDFKQNSHNRISRELELELAVRAENEVKKLVKSPEYQSPGFLASLRSAPQPCQNGATYMSVEDKARRPVHKAEPDPNASPIPAPRLPAPRSSPPAQIATLPSDISGSRYDAIRKHQAEPASLRARTDAVAADFIATSEHLPYVPAEEREAVLRGKKKLFKDGLGDSSQPRVYHVDFSVDEVAKICSLVRAALLHRNGAQGRQEDSQPTRTELAGLLRKHCKSIRSLARKLDLSDLKRSESDVHKFLVDLSESSTAGATASSGQVLFVSSRTSTASDVAPVRKAESRIRDILASREMAGIHGTTSMRRGRDFRNELRTAREDDLQLRVEWSDCAGDIATAAWCSDDSFICGTTTHSDARNQQYNKPGNLLMGSAQTGSLQAYPDHRIVRPTVDQGENSTDAMRQSQDPWLYTSVVSVDYDAVHGRAYTAGFDKTAKVWNVDPSGTSMESVATWHHRGNVNFVVASKYHDPVHDPNHADGLVATAADWPHDAVRVYKVNGSNPGQSTYRTFTCSRIVDSNGNPVPVHKWSYFPATIRWGLAESVKHLFLVGYSPRSLTSDDNDIPEDRQNSGEICLFDGLTGERWKIVGGTVQNVFEVAWHPTQACFIVASSPKSFGVEPGVRTQIRIFTPSFNREFGGMAYLETQVLDCTAVDINELVIKPNSPSSSFIAAGCTDGKTYIWDTALGDKPIHVLKHGPSVEEHAGDVISNEDTGIKFVAWGATLDRLYTGSSDGVVKVWDIRSQQKPFVRNLLQCDSAVSYGAFSPDASKLVVGDASGRVFLLTPDDEDEDSPLAKALWMDIKLPDGTTRSVRRPRPYIPHPEPPAPDAASEGRSIARRFLDTEQLRLSGDPTIGAVKGRNYAETGLYRAEAHLDGDPSQPLLARIDLVQLENTKMYDSLSTPRRRNAGAMSDRAAVAAQHARNTAVDLDPKSLDPEVLDQMGVTREQLVKDAQVDDTAVDWGFQYEELPEGVLTVDNGEEDGDHDRGHGSDMGVDSSARE